MSGKEQKWQSWAEVRGIDMAGVRRMPLNDYNVAIQAAIDGGGVAIGRQLAKAGGHRNTVS
ncbi:hypothetical protein [Ruegeria arenilitoris]|uniref:hypothetical protein n=1 Tax=Ruegeria arenilitoris TaxID=1173585 RepID=UPI00147E7C87|nr:hypothetical protein [Ruegeria arenilitoris]